MRSVSAPTPVSGDASPKPGSFGADLRSWTGPGHGAPPWACLASAERDPRVLVECVTEGTIDLPGLATQILVGLPHGEAGSRRPVSRHTCSNARRASAAHRVELVVRRRDSLCQTEASHRLLRVSATSPRPCRALT